MGELEEQLEAAFELSKSRREKLLTKTELTVQDIQPVMRLYCDETGITYYDVWTKRDFGSAKNWLRYCKENGIRPRRQLRNVVWNWMRFRQGQLHNDDGKMIMLRETVGFTEYFKWRKQIDAWLTAHPLEVQQPEASGPDEKIVWEKW